jgi:adenylate cyclase
VAGFRPSRKNPNLCSRCCDTLPPGGLEIDIAVLFADVRGSTALCERIGPGSFAELLNHFYRVATAVLIRHDAIIDKLIGDEVMALFVPGIAYVGVDHVVDFTALGDPVNTAARLQAEAGPGELLIADEVYRDLGDLFPGAEHRELRVRGRAAPVGVGVVRVPA